MRKLLFVIMILVMSLSLVACFPEESSESLVESEITSGTETTPGSEEESNPESELESETGSDSIVTTMVITIDENGGSEVEDVEVEGGTFEDALATVELAKLGYTFAGWEVENEGEWTALVLTDTITADVTVRAVWTANTDTAYTVNHYQQNVENDEYTLVATDDMTGTTDAETAAVAKDYAELGFKVANAFEQSTISAEGNTVVNIYYDRVVYELAFEGAEIASPITAKHGKTFETILADVELTKLGYTFAGWEVENEGEWTALVLTDVITSNTTLRLVWTANTDTAYTVNHYQQNAENDEYTLVATDDMTGTTDAETAAVAKDYAESGFKAANAFEQATISPEGNTVVNIYYDRVVYTVAYASVDGVIFEGDVSIKHGGKLSFSATASEGYYGDSLVVKCNDETLVAVEGIYTVENVASDLALTATIEQNLAVSVDADAIYFNVAGKETTATVSANISASFSSSDDSIATVSSEGVVTAVGSGNVTITATTATGQVSTVELSVYTGISNGDEFATTLLDNPTKNYILTADISVDIGSYNLKSFNVTFSGVLDGDGHKITMTGVRLFQDVTGTIKNLSVEVDGLGTWGAVFGDTLSEGGRIENVAIKATMASTRAYVNNSLWFARNAGVMFNFNNGGSINNCAVYMVLPATLSIDDGLPVADMKAFFCGGSAPATSVTNSVAYYVNNKTSDEICALGNEKATKAVASLGLGETVQLLAGATSYVSSNDTVATVTADGLVTAVAGGSATITVTYRGLTFDFAVNVWMDIATIDDLAGMYNNLAGYYRLVADIEMPKALDTYFYEKYGTFPIYSDATATFSGVLDGQNHKIYGANNGGRLFTTVTGTIKNLVIENNSIGGWGAGLCYNTSASGLIENVTIIAVIAQTNSMNVNTGDCAYRHTNQAGLLVSNAGTIKDCKVYAVIPSNIAITDGFALADVSALCTDNSGSVINCEAYCINQFDGTTMVQFVKNNTGFITEGSKVVSTEERPVI